MRFGKMCRLQHHTGIEKSGGAIAADDRRRFSGLADMINTLEIKHFLPDLAEISATIPTGIRNGDA